jgi:hypothetical protein
MMALVTGQYVINGNARSSMTRSFFGVLLTRIGTSTVSVLIMTNARIVTTDYGAQLNYI